MEVKYTKQNTVQIIVLALSVLGFMWAIWQHEVLMWDWIHSVWNEPHAFFSGVITTKGVAYDFTLLMIGLPFLTSLIALWFWNTAPAVTIKAATVSTEEPKKTNFSMVILAMIIIFILVVTGFLSLGRDQFGVDLLPQAKNLFFGIIVALVFGVGSYAKSVTPENFDPVKFSITMILSLIIGVAMFYFKLDYSTASVAVTSFAAQTGLTALVEVWLKAIFRTIQKQPAA